MSKHLTLDDRSIIEHALLSKCSLRQITTQLGRSVYSIGREIRKRRFAKDSGAFGRITNRCIQQENETIARQMKTIEDNNALIAKLLEQAQHRVACIAHGNPV